MFDAVGVGVEQGEEESVEYDFMIWSVLANFERFLFLFLFEI